MDDAKKINLLNEELDDESAKYITEQISQWKEGVLSTLMEQVETAKAEKLEELEQKNEEYREELKEEYSDKLTEAISEIRDAIRADVTAEVLKNNPELKIFEQIKEMVAPTLDEGYKANTYSETIEQLASENEALKRNAEIMEGAETLSELLAPYEAKTQSLVLSLIKEGNSEEIREQFVNIMSSLEEVVSEAEKDEDDDEEDEDEDKGTPAKDDDAEDDNDDEDEDDEDEEVEESFIDEGYEGEDFEEEELDEDFASMKNMIKSYI